NLRSTAYGNRPGRDGRASIASRSRRACGSPPGPRWTPDRRRAPGPARTPVARSTTPGAAFPGSQPFAPDNRVALEPEGGGIRSMSVSASVKTLAVRSFLRVCAWGTQALEQGHHSLGDHVPDRAGHNQVELVSGRRPGGQGCADERGLLGQVIG